MGREDEIEFLPLTWAPSALAKVADPKIKVWPNQFLMRALFLAFRWRLLSMSSHGLSLMNSHGERAQALWHFFL